MCHRLKRRALIPSWTDFLSSLNVETQLHTFIWFVPYKVNFLIILSAFKIFQDSKTKIMHLIAQISYSFCCSVYKIFWAPKVVITVFQLNMTSSWVLYIVQNDFSFGVLVSIIKNKISFLVNLILLPISWKLGELNGEAIREAKGIFFPFFFFSFTRKINSNHCSTSYVRNTFSVNRAFPRK